MNSTVSTLRKTTLALAVVAAVYAGTAMAAGPASSSQATVRHAAVLHRNDVVLGALPAKQLMHLELELQVRNQAKLDAFIANIGKPGHPRIMSAAQWDADHAPTAAQAQRVVSYLKSMGINNVEVSSDRMLVHVLNAPADAVSRAFATNLVQVKTADGRMAYAHTIDATLPSSVRNDVFTVAGLQTVNLAHTFAKKYNASGIHTDAGSVTGHLSTDFPSIYSNTSMPVASGVVVGIFTQGSMKTTISDLNKFTAAHSFATVTTTEVDTDGTSTSTSGVDEWDLDSQDIVAQAGGAVSKIIWYQTPSLSEADMDANFATIVSANAAKIVNVSIGGCETSSEVSGAADGDTNFSKGVTQGQTFSISTGDSGADECSDGGTTPSWPANSQYVTSAAGTTLTATTGTSAVWGGETAWSDSGGSESKYEAKPSWQPSSCTSPCSFDGKHKGVADVAFDADPNSGAQLYLNGASPSTSTQVGGTSLAAPLNSGTWARVIASKGTSVGFEAPLLYAISGATAGTSAAFHDITSGSNGLSPAKGWDVVSGLGSIVGSTMLADLGGGATGGTPTASFSDTTSGLTATFTDNSSDSGGTIGTYAWTFGDGSTSSAASPGSHTYSAAGSYTVSLTVTDSSDGKTSTTSQVVTVSSGSTGGTPTAAFTDTTSGLTATFTNGSTDSGGTIGTYAWTFGDNGTSSSASPSHTYAAAGTYTVGLVVTDSTSGKTSSVSHSVTVSAPSSQQLLANTGFESSGSWTASSGVLCTNSTCSGETAYAGTGFAWLDGYGSTHTDTLSQAATIPSGVSTATVQYYLHIDTAETTKTTAYDKLTVGLYSGSTLVATLGSFSNLNAASGYTVHSASASVASYVGKSLTLKFTGSEDASLQTSFVIDNVTMTVQ